MAYSTIEREIRIAASPDVVYEVITRPEHIKDWWGFSAAFPAVPGGVGEMTWERDGGSIVVPILVVEADRPRRLAYRWVHPQGSDATPQNSFLVTFDLIADGDGTLLRLTESGFEDVAWGKDELQTYHDDHVDGWDRHLPDLAAYAPTVVPV